MYVLYYSKDPWKFPECADGSSSCQKSEYLAEQGVKELILVAQETTLVRKKIFNGEKIFAQTLERAV